MSRRRALQAIAVVVLLYGALQILGLPHLGLTDDDDFYIPAGISYAEWVQRAVSFRDGAWSRESIDRAFALNKEHPPVAKYVFGACHFLFRGFLGPTDSARVGTTLFSTLIALVLCLMSLSCLGTGRGLVVGALSSLFLLILPRFYFHSHAATLDVPVAAMYVATAGLTLLSERSWRAGVATGVVFGLACATKLNAPFLILPYLAFVLLVRWPSRARRGGETDGATSKTEGRSTARVPGLLSVPSLPIALVSMVVVGPIVFFAVWPWLWFDTAQRIVEYVGFHLHHYGIYFLYFGRVYVSNPVAPWHAPFVMTALTTPLPILALGAAGAALGARWVAVRIGLRARLRAQVQVQVRVQAQDPASDERTRREADLVLTAALHAVFSIAVVAFFPGPKYGGEKLFMPAFPFLCLLAGYGALRLVEAGRHLVGRVWPGVALVGVAASSSLAWALSFGAYGLSAYNGLAGGLAGATALGFERQYYDVAYRDLVAWLNREAPSHLSIHFLPNNWEYVRTYRWYALAKELRADIRVVESEAQAKWVILTHERRFARYGEDLRRFRNRSVLLERMVDGVPLFTVLDATGTKDVEGVRGLGGP